MKKILLVEDEVTIIDIYKTALEEADYQVEVIEDGQQALNTILENPSYDLILLDIMLPNLDGISLLKQLKQANSAARDIPVIILTNLGVEKLIDQAISLGAKKSLLKSNTLPAELVEEVNKFFYLRSPTTSVLHTPSPPARKLP